MSRLKDLEEWVQDLLAQPVTTLALRFDDWGTADEDIEALPFFSWYRPQFRWVSEGTLTRLHRKLRVCQSEGQIWRGLLWRLDNPLPLHVAHDLVSRKVAVVAMMHSRQVDEVQWRLVRLYQEEPLLTLVKDLYTDPKRTPEEFQAVLDEFSSDNWMMESLAHAIASSPEKEQAFLEAARRHPKANLLLTTQEGYYWSGETQYSSGAEGFQRKLDEMIRDARHNLGALYGTTVPEELLVLAADPQTPDEILHELTHLKGVPLATRIRRAAERNLESGSAG